MENYWPNEIDEVMLENMKQVNLLQAKTGLSALLKEAEAGEQVVIARAGKAVAKLVPVDKPTRSFGLLSFRVSADFDAPLNENELAERE